MSLSLSPSTTTFDSSSALQNISLTPPTSLRLPRSVQTQQLNGRHFQQQFTPDDSTDSLFDQTNQQQIKLNNNNNNNNPLNGLKRNGLNSVSTKNCLTNDNKFTPEETEFIADFSSANIFNANGINSNNNNGSCLNNGSSESNKVINGVVETNSTANGENFADFDHNPIYNANNGNFCYFNCM